IRLATSGVRLWSRLIAQPVHSWNDDQTTDGRCARLVSASATSGAPAGPTPMSTAMPPQNFKKSRRDTPMKTDISSSGISPPPRSPYPPWGTATRQPEPVDARSIPLENPDKRRTAYPARPIPRCCPRPPRSTAPMRGLSKALVGTVSLRCVLLAVLVFVTDVVVLWIA